MNDSGGDAALRYYDHDGAPLPLVLDALRESGRDGETIAIDDLAGIDEFHALGRPATMALAELACVGPGSRSSTSAPASAARPASSPRASARA